MRFWERRWAGAIAIAIVLGVYAPTLVMGRVDLDDLWLWGDESPLRELSGATLHDVFFELDAELRHPLGNEYLPVRDVAVALDMAVWDDNAHGPHATQLALFALSVFGLGTLLIRFGFARSVAWLGALAWALHPMRVESVAWLSERKSVLAGLFVMACGHAWVRYRRGGSQAWLVAGALAALAGVWSNAPAMFAPAALLALDLILLAPSRRRWIAAVAIGTAAALAAVPVVLVARDARVIDNTDVPSPGRLQRALGAQGHYLASLALVRPVATNYPIQTDGPSGGDLALGALAVLGSAGLAYAWRRKAQPLALLAWTWIWFAPISQLLIPVHILVADRFAYLWAVGPMVGIVLAIELLPRARTALAALLLCSLAVITLRAEEPWTSSTELFLHALESNPGDPLAYRNLALAQDMTMHTKIALATVDRGLSEHPTHVRLLLAKVFILESMGHRTEALATARFAVAATGSANAKWVLAMRLESHKRFDEALPYARAAFEKHPEIADYARTYGMLALVRGHAEIAVVALRAIRHPGPRDRFELGRALLSLGRAAEAEREFVLAIAAAPGLASQSRGPRPEP